MPTPTPATERATVLYDGACAFCRRSIALVRRLDWLGRLSYVDFRDPASPILKPPVLAQAPLVDEMHLLTPDDARLHHGFDALRWLAWRLPLLWLIAPFLYIPGVPPLGQKLYLWIARNRFRLVPCHGGVCTIQSKEIPTTRP
jgi:predicted DCC family thiol-disulfide oxidoreductase YuxK